MGFFTDLLNCIFQKDERFGLETENAIEQLSDWDSERMSYNCNIYYPESGEWIYLDQMTIPKRRLNHWESIRENTIASKAEQIYKLFVKEIESFRSYVEKLDSLNWEAKNDGFFTEVDHIFANKIKKLHNELLFCKFEKLGNLDYYNKIINIIDSIYADLKLLNTYFSDYMYALSRLGYEDNKSDLERIKISVKAMSEAVDTIKSDI